MPLKHFLIEVTTPAGFARRLGAGMLSLNLLVIGLGAYSIHEDRLEYERRARTTVQNLSQLLAKDIASVFDRCNLVLHSVSQEIEKQLASGSVRRTQLNAFLKQQQSYLPEIISLRVTDEDGLIRYGQGVPGGAPVDLSDREHFIMQRGNPKAGLFVGRPVQSRINKEWVIPLTRRINRSNGDFAGIVSINIPVAYFVNQFSRLDLGSQGLIVLRSTEHTAMARFPEQLEGGGAIGQAAVSDQLRNLLKNNPENVTYAAPSPADKIERIYSYQKLKGYPLYVVSGLATRDIMQEWQWDRVQTIVVVALFGILTLLFSKSLVRAWRRQLSANDELRLSSTVFNLADEGMVVTNRENNILSVNPAFTAITGYTPEEVIGRNPQLLSAKTHTKEFYRKLWSTLIESGSWSGEVLNRKKDGEAYIEWLTIKRVLNEQGELTHHVAIFSDITARKADEARMRHLALHDALTDLPNRALLTERLDQAIIRSRRDKSCLALIYFDLDRFKPVNDTYGHEVGDWLLKSVADRVVDCVRESDTVSRIGGDEFIVLLPGLENDKDALAVAEKIRAALAKPFLFAELAFEISTSIGVAIYPAHADDEKTLTRNADIAMYHAKKNGRNRVVLYQADMQPE